jgi:peroxiredoxin
MRIRNVEMKGWRNFFLIISFVLLTAIVTNAYADSDNKPVSPMEIEKLNKSKAPEFSLKDLNGKRITLSSFKGKVVLLNFWATWCPPCLAEMPSFKKLYSEMRSSGLEIIAISTDRSVNETRGFTDKKGFDFPILMDEDRAVTKQYKVFSLPTTFLIDRNGVIIEKFFGENDWASREMKKKIGKLK